MLLLSPSTSWYAKTSSYWDSTWRWATAVWRLLSLSPALLQRRVTYTATGTMRIQSGLTSAAFSKRVVLDLANFPSERRVMYEDFDNGVQHVRSAAFGLSHQIHLALEAEGSFIKLLCSTQNSSQIKRLEPLAVLHSSKEMHHIFRAVVKERSILPRSAYSFSLDTNLRGGNDTGHLAYATDPQKPGSLVLRQIP